MPSLAFGKTSWTAWASTWAVEWRRTARPSGSSIRTGSTTSSGPISVARSFRTPFTRAKTTARSSAKRSAAVSDTVGPLTRAEPARTRRRHRGAYRAAPAGFGQRRGGSDLADLHRVETAVEGHGVDLAGPVDAEGRDRAERADLTGGAAGPAEPDASRDEVGVDVPAGDQLLVLRAAVHVAAGDGLAERVRVRGDRSAVRGARDASARVIDAVALAARPAEVPAALACRDAVDLLDGVLADVTDPEVAGLGVDRGAPRVAHAVRPDLVPHRLRREV